MKDDTLPATKADIHMLVKRFDRVNEDIDRILGFLVKYDKPLTHAIPNHEQRIKTLPLREKAG